MPTAWIEDVLPLLARRDAWGYRPGESPAAEPTALCALALLGHDRGDDAVAALDVLTTMQSPDGAVGVHADESAPHWGTAYAVLAWQAALRKLPTGHASRDRYAAAADGGCKFLLSDGYKGTVLDPKVNREVGHNTMLVGWPWIEKTHSWLEPTALAYLALKSSGLRTHRRAVEAVALMIDRLLPDGGCNHGNTFVLGQVLKPHIQPTGLVMLAIPYEGEGQPRVEKSLDYLEHIVDETTTAASLAYALHGLAAHRRSHARADELLAGALAKPTIDVGANGTRRPLLALAALGEKSPLVDLSRTGGPP